MGVKDQRISLAKDELHSQHKGYEEMVASLKTHLTFQVEYFQRNTCLFYLFIYLFSYQFLGKTDCKSKTLTVGK